MAHQAQRPQDRRRRCDDPAAGKRVSPAALARRAIHPLRQPLRDGNGAAAAKPAHRRGSLGALSGHARRSGGSLYTRPFSRLRVYARRQGNRVQPERQNPPPESGDRRRTSHPVHRQGFRGPWAETRFPAKRTFRARQGAADYGPHGISRRQNAGVFRDDASLHLRPSERQATAPDQRRFDGISTGFDGGQTGNADLVWVPAEGGDAELSLPARGAGGPHFTNEKDRIYVYTPQGLVSLRYDG